MSYQFTMNFKKIPKDQLFDFCTNLAELYYQQAEEIITNNIYYNPTNQRKFNSVQQRIVDKLWLTRLFNISLVYWADEELLGMHGDVITDEIKKQFATQLDFQNVADQNYDYDYWSGIDCFEKTVEQIKNMSVEQFMATDENNNYEYDDVREDFDYWQKTRVYDTIFNTLNLNNWLYDEPGNFKRFAVNAITDEKRPIELYKLLKKIDP